MKYPALVAVAFLQELLFLGTVPFTYSQRTNARQGIGRDPPTIKIPGQGTIVGRDVNINKYFLNILIVADFFFLFFTKL